MTKNTALLIIDMQKGSFNSETPRFESDKIIEQINLLSTQFRDLNYTVIHIQHDGTGTGEFEKNTNSWGILDEINVKPDDVLIDKYANDVFYQSQLQKTLSQLKITNLVITGCATDFCVESTIQSALTKDYNITVVEDGHTTGDRPHLKAEKIIKHYNWVWQNMLPTQGSITVEKANFIINQNKTN